MLVYLLSIIINIFFFVVGLLLKSLGWLKQTTLSVKEDWKNVFKLVGVFFMTVYIISRIMLIDQLYIKDEHTKFTEKDLTPRREVRLERYVKLQEKTLILDRYANAVMFIKYDDRPLLAKIVYTMTCNYRFLPFSSLVWDRHCMSIIEQNDQEKLDEYLDKVTWLTDQEKQQKVNKLKLIIKNKQK